MKEEDGELNKGNRVMDEFMGEGLVEWEGDCDEGIVGGGCIGKFEAVREGVELGKFCLKGEVTCLDSVIGLIFFNHFEDDKRYYYKN